MQSDIIITLENDIVLELVAFHKINITLLMPSIVLLPMIQSQSFACIQHEFKHLVVLPQPYCCGRICDPY